MGNRSKLIKIIVGYLIAAALVAALIRIYRIDDWSRLIDCRWGWLIAGLGISLIGNLAGAWRWYCCLGILGSQGRVSPVEVFYFHSSANLFGLTGLGSLLGTAVRPLMLKTHSQVPLPAALGSVALDRILDILWCVVFIVPTILYLSEILDVRTAFLGASVIFVVIGITAVAYGDGIKAILVRAVEFIPRLTAKIKQVFRRGKPAGQDASPPESNSLHIASLSRVDLAMLLGLTLLKYAFMALRLQWIGYAIGVELPFTLLMAGMTLLQLSLFVSPTPGAIGVAEWGWAVVLICYGTPSGDAALAGMAFRVYLMLFVVIQAVLAFGFHRLGKFRILDSEQFDR
jgi:uncharacterized protein (TIRG00374 family)